MAGVVYLQIKKLKSTVISDRWDVEYEKKKEQRITS
jgi:hypothetical protein